METEQTDGTLFEGPMGIKVKQRALPWILLGALVGGGGGSSLSFLDFFNAKGFVNQNAEALAHIPELEAEIVSCRAEKALLMDLLRQQASGELPVAEVVEIPESASEAEGSE